MTITKGNGLYVASPPTLHAYALSLLRLALNNPSAEFRDGQWETIESLVEHDARMLVVQRTAADVSGGNGEKAKRKVSDPTQVCGLVAQNV